MRHLLYLLPYFIMITLLRLANNDHIDRITYASILFFTSLWLILCAFYHHRNDKTENNLRKILRKLPDISPQMADFIFCIDVFTLTQIIIIKGWLWLAFFYTLSIFLKYLIIRKKRRIITVAER